MKCNDRREKERSTKNSDHLNTHRFCIGKTDIKSMHHVNESYDHESDRISVDQSPSSRQKTPSPKVVKQVNSTSIDNESLKSNHESYPTVATIEPTIISTDQTQDTTDNQIENPLNTDPYYSLKYLQERRRGKRDEDAKLPRRVKKFYKYQDELIDVYQRLHSSGPENESGNDAYKESKQKELKISKILTQVSLGVNMVSEILISSSLENSLNFFLS